MELDSTAPLDPAAAALVAPLDVSSILAVDESRRKAISVFKEIAVEIDLGLLAVYDPNPIEDSDYVADKEQTLLSNARDGIQLLVNAVWAQPTRIADDGLVASLPPVTTALPREKPLPKAAPMTKWQAFATAKGIAPKPRRDRLVFDDEKQDWVPKWGYKGKNKEIEDQWIVEVPKDKDPNFDPVAASKDARKASLLKNKTQQLKNQQRAAANDATATAAAAASSSMSKSARNNAAQQKTAANNAMERKERKVVIERDLMVTKTATASMGKFDRKLEGEGKEKNIKRKFAANEVSAPSERSTALNILTSIGAHPTNKRTKVSADAPTAGDSDGLVNPRKAIKNLTGGRGVGSLDASGKRGGRGGRGRGRGRGK